MSPHYRVCQLFPSLVSCLLTRLPGFYVLTGGMLRILTNIPTLRGSSIFKKSSLPSSGSQVTADCRPVTTKRLDLSSIWIMKDTIAHPLAREAIHDPRHLLFYLQMLQEKIFSIKLNNNAIAAPRCGGRNVPGAAGR